MQTAYLFRSGALLLAALACTAADAVAQENRSFSAQLRYRHEYVKDEAFARQADADTLRLRLGYKPKINDAFSAFIEAEAVAELNDDFNSGANRQTNFPMVADARSVELNQAWLDWKGERAGMRVGRQRIALDNQRFIGNVGWRQNEQTFDAINFSTKLANKTEVQLLWLARVHRVFGDEAVDRLARERELDGRLLRIQQTLPVGALVGYGYWIEDKDVPTASSRTLGLRWSGTKKQGDWAWGAALEFARQSGYADAQVGHANYWLIEPRIEWAGKTFKLGHEHLGAGSPRSFQTPLATLHAFNGWADKFLTTPAGGLEDTYASAQGGFNWRKHKGKWELALHDFQADNGNDYGTEWNASLGLNLRPGLDALVKLADYRSDGFARDTRKVWVQLEWVY